MTAHRFTLAAVALVATAALAACGSDEEEPASNAPASEQAGEQEEHNDADVSFAQGMIPHHRQAVEMAGLADDRAASAEVTDLANRIEEAQGPEIETLTGWLEGWGEEVPAEGHASHEGHEGQDMEIAELEGASGEAFDALFMEMMIEHHEGAVAMAETEQAEGAYGPAREMAQDIIISQSAEIDEMNTLLGEE
jgi:uncharacterized protein (DUF305 family)